MRRHVMLIELESFRTLVSSGARGSPVRSVLITASFYLIPSWRRRPADVLQFVSIKAGFSAYYLNVEMDWKLESSGGLKEL